MMYQIAGLTSDEQYYKCIAILKDAGISTERQHGRVALFDTREDAEALLPLLQAAAPDAEFRIAEVSDATLGAA